MPVSVRYNKLKTFKEDLKVSSLKLDISQKKTWQAEPKIDVIKKLDKDKSSKGHIISKIACSLWYVTTDTYIRELVPALIAEPEIRELGVVDENMQTIGIIVRMDLLNFLNNRYGKQLLVNRTINDLLGDEDLQFLIMQTPEFHFNRDIFSVIAELKNKLETTEKIRFLLTKKDGTFAGIFTNIDVLLYLSVITRMDIDQAAELQSRVVKEKTYFNTGIFEFSATSKMAKGVGGDFYIADKHLDDRWVLSLCDVSGKGVSAGLLTTLLGALFTIYDFKKGLGNFVKQINRYIFNTFNMEKYLTGFFATFDEKTGKLVYYDMGHAYVFIYRNKKLFMVKSSDKNIPIGFVEEVEAVANEIVLQKSDYLMIFTDGFSEQTNFENKEYPLLNKLPELIEKNPFEKVLEMLSLDIDSFRGIQPQADDMTAFILKYNG